jgi:endo-1,4-beta-xylanase
VLFWHSQTPAWFFRDGTRDLTSSPADQALLRARMRAHVKGIADHLDARYPDGDSPIWAWDVVNEVIADGDTPNRHDMRDSRWFQVLGEGFVDEAFRLADEHFPDAALFINDYNTEMPEKRADYLSLIRTAKVRGVPIDGVGHQAHVDVARPVQWLEDSIAAVEALDPTSCRPSPSSTSTPPPRTRGADVSGGTLAPYTPAFEDPADAGAEVGYYYRDLFAMLRGRRGGRLGDLLGHQQRPQLAADVADGPSVGAAAALRRRPAGRARVLGHRRPEPAAGPPGRRPAAAHRRRVGRCGRSRPAAPGVKLRYALPSTIDTRDGVVPVTCTPARGPASRSARPR